MTLTPTPRQMAGGNFYKNAFMYDKVLERISHQPTMMGVIPVLLPRATCRKVSISPVQTRDR